MAADEPVFKADVLSMLRGDPPGTRRVAIGPGEIVVESAKAANLVHEHMRLSRALHSLEALVEAARNAADDVEAALRAEPEFDAIPPVIAVEVLLSPELHAVAAALVPAHPIDPKRTVALVAQALVDAAASLPPSSRKERTT